MLQLYQFKVDELTDWELTRMTAFVKAVILSRFNNSKDFTISVTLRDGFLDSKEVHLLASTVNLRKEIIQDDRQNRKESTETGEDATGSTESGQPEEPTEHAGAVYTDQNSEKGDGRTGDSTPECTDSSDRQQDTPSCSEGATEGSGGEATVS